MLGLDIISYIVTINKNSPTLSKIDIIFSEDSQYYFISDLKEEIDEINKMPEHIKVDWIDNNKNKLTVTFLNNYIRNLNLLNEYLIYGTKDYYKREKELKLLIQIRTQLIKNGDL